eukprot:TRINITY_DN1273_c0_g1_i1.p1 TRINITY_DN1273_c0_g1~~TRINITY_DN1273_c0_g1_i1.p1  ORF type:complete len:310 (+),score=80.01 TRINITY_DN1273_c0_g1_i1:22-951(+)
MTGLDILLFLGGTLIGIGSSAIFGLILFKILFLRESPRDFDYPRVHVFDSFPVPGQPIADVPQSNDGMCQLINSMAHKVYSAQNKHQDLSSLLQTKITDILRDIQIPAFVAPVVLHRLNIGASLPHLTHVNFLPSQDDSSQFVAEIGIEYAGGLTIGASTEILMKFQGMQLGSLPLSLSITIQGFAGNALVICRNAVQGSLPAMELVLGFSSIPDVQLDIHSSIGAQTKLTDIKHISDLIRKEVRANLAKMLVIDPSELERSQTGIKVVVPLVAGGQIQVEMIKGDQHAQSLEAARMHDQAREGRIKAE